MSTGRVSRPLPIAVTALVAFFSALGALAFSNGMDMAQAHGNQPMSMIAHGSPMLKAKAVELRTDMRKLWEDHITWTRLAIISLTTHSPDTEATVGRLLQNQTDIGNAVKPFYGDAAGDQLTSLLTQHILIAADLIAAAQAGDETAVAAEQARWVANADQIAAALHSLNPHNWPLAEMQEMMHRHLDLTTQEVVARLQGNWNADVAAYDKVHLEILEMSDVISEGIVKQFPARFR
jgi:hypothetical protein